MEKFKVKVIHNGCSEVAEKLCKAIDLCPLLKSDGVYESAHLDSGTIYTIGDYWQRKPQFSFDSVSEPYKPPFWYEMPKLDFTPIWATV